MPEYDIFMSHNGADSPAVDELARDAGFTLLEDHEIVESVTTDHHGLKVTLAEGDHDESLAAGGPDPDRRVLRREMRDRLSAALEGLPDRQRAVVVLRHYQEMKTVILDENGEYLRDCEPNEIGVIVMRGPNVFRGYVEEAHNEGVWVQGDWLNTGDLGRMDADGYLTITGRSKELIIRGGENIAPREIDDVLYQHEAILEAAAVGVDDENYGQEVVACVALRDGYQCSEDELKAFCEAGVGKYKMPKTIYFFDELPKGPSGKILRLKLPELIAKTIAGE